MMCRGRHIQERNAGSRLRRSYCAVYQTRAVYQAASVMSNRDPIQYRDTEWVPYAMGASDLPQSVHQQSRT